MHEASWDVEQTGFLYCVGVYHAKKSVEAGFPSLKLEQNKGLWALFYWCFGYWLMLAYKISTCKAYIIWRKPIKACKIQCQLPSGGWLKLQWSHQGRLFHGSWWDPFRIHGNQYMCGAMWDVEHSLAKASLNIYKTTQMNERRRVWKKIKITGLKLKIKLKIEVNQSQNR